MEQCDKQLVIIYQRTSKIALSAFLVCWGMAGLLACSSVSADVREKPSRTWKTLAELSAEERARLDLSPETPRHPQFPYLPAEPYPFSPPYSAEEMGLRAAVARCLKALKPGGMLLITDFSLPDSLPGLREPAHRPALMDLFMEMTWGHRLQT